MVNGLIRLTAILQCILGCKSIYTSSRKGADRRLENVSPVETLSEVTLARCQLICADRGDCLSFNFHPTDRICEIFTTTVCGDTGASVGSAQGWIWYDVLSSRPYDSLALLWHDEGCAQNSTCRSDLCEAPMVSLSEEVKGVGSSCQRAKDCKDRITGNSRCRGKICLCNNNHWEFNTTLCVRMDEKVITDGTHRIWKKIQHDVYEIKFHVKASYNVSIYLSEALTLPANTYVFRLGLNENTLSTLDRDPVQGGSTTVSSFAGATLSSTENHRFTISWSNGELRFSRRGGSTYLSFDDRQPFQPVYVGFESGVEAVSWTLVRDMFDPWMGDWSAERVYRVPRYSAITRKKNIGSRNTYEFECRSASECQLWIFSDLSWGQSQRYGVLLGESDNSRSSILRVNGSSEILASVDSPGIVSDGEFRKFVVKVRQISIGKMIKVYKDKEENDPLLEALDPDPFEINYVALKNCCNDNGMEVKVAKFHGRWAYENDYRWGAGLE